MIINRKIDRCFMFRCLNAIVLAVGLAACGAESPTAPGQGDARDAPVSSGSVNIYSARHYDSDLAIYDAFTDETGIRVNLIESGSDELIERIRTEGELSPADILITVDAGRIWRAVEADLFEPVQSDVLQANIPANLRSPDDLWFAFTQRARVIAYNDSARESRTG